MEKDHDRLPLRRTFCICPDIQRQAVLSLKVIGADLRRPFTLDGAFSEVSGLINTGPVPGGDRIFPAKPADRRFGKGDPLVGDDRALSQSDIGPVIAYGSRTPVIGSINLPVDPRLGLHLSPGRVFR